MNLFFIRGRKNLSIIACVLCLSCIGLMACGGNEQEAANSADGSEDAASAAETQSEEVAADIPAGWGSGEFEGWKIAIPPDWNGDADIGVWWQGDGDMSRGRPPVSLHVGGMPVMPGSSFEDKLMARTNDKPLERKTVTVSGFHGCTCSWEVMGKKHLGLFVEEKISGSMSIVHFVDCQAPAAEFDQLRGTFEQIIASAQR